MRESENMENIFEKEYGRFTFRFPDEQFDPTKHSIATGDDAVLDDIFSFAIYNYNKNHWRGAAAPADKQPGMIRSDSDDERLFHRQAAAWKDIFQADTPVDASADIYIGEYIYHVDDVDTYIRFRDDRITLYAGAIDFIDAVEAATNYLKLLAGKNFIGDTENAKMTMGLTINQAAADNEILAFKSLGSVTHGCTDYAETDTYGLWLKAHASDGGLEMRGFSEGERAVQLVAYYTTDDTGKTTADNAAIQFNVYKISGTGRGNVGANANMLAIKAYRGGSAESVWILDEDGDTWQTGHVIAEAGASVAAANMVTALGIAEFLRTTSSKKYKDKIKDLDLDSKLIYNLQPRSFNSLCKADNKDKRFIGLIAEEIEQVYPEMVNYNENNEAESYDNQMIMTLILAEVQKHEISIEALKAQLNN